MKGQGGTTTISNQAGQNRTLEDSGADLLIVDDDEGILELLTAYGRLNGWQTVAVTSLSAALKVLAYSQPSVIILDWQLPDSD